MVSALGSTEQMNDLNQQLINSMSAGKSQPPSGSGAYRQALIFLID
jgi:hypothetical protein